MFNKHLTIIKYSAVCAMIKSDGVVRRKLWIVQIKMLSSSGELAVSQQMF